MIIIIKKNKKCQPSAHTNSSNYRNYSNPKRFENCTNKLCKLHCTRALSANLIHRFSAENKTSNYRTAANCAFHAERFCEHSSQTHTLCICTYIISPMYKYGYYGDSGISVPGNTNGLYIRN